MIYLISFIFSELLKMERHIPSVSATSKAELTEITSISFLDLLIAASSRHHGATIGLPRGCCRVFMVAPIVAVVVFVFALAIVLLVA